MASGKISLEMLVQEFVANVREQAMVEAEAEVVNLLNGRSGRSKGAPAPRVAGARLPARRRGAKRSPEAINALTEELLQFIKHNPGLRIEQIGKALQVSTAELLVPVKRVLSSGDVVTEGQRRATTYHPNGKRAKAPKRAAKRKNRKNRRR